MVPIAVTRVAAALTAISGCNVLTLQVVNSEIEISYLSYQGGLFNLYWVIEARLLIR